MRTYPLIAAMMLAVPVALLAACTEVDAPERRVTAIPSATPTTGTAGTPAGTPSGALDASGVPAGAIRPAEPRPLASLAPHGEPFGVGALVDRLVEMDGSVTEFPVGANSCSLDIGLYDVVKLGLLRVEHGGGAQDVLVWVYAAPELLGEQWERSADQDGTVLPGVLWRCNTSVAESVDTVYVNANLLIAFSKTGYPGVGLAQSEDGRAFVLAAFRSLLAP